MCWRKWCALGAVLGGEQSGHVIFRQFATTGDGILTALRVVEIARNAGRGAARTDRRARDLSAAAAECAHAGSAARCMNWQPWRAKSKNAQQAFGSSGRVLVRFSGTEPLARVMVEGPDLARVEEYTSRIAEAIRKEIGE